MLVHPSDDRHVAALWIGSRRWRWRRSGRAAEVEVHLGRHVSSLACGEVRPRGKAEQPGKEGGRHGLHGRVIRLNRFIKLSALDGDAIFGSLELCLQFLEIRVGLQFRIALHNHEQTGERVGQLVLRLLKALERLRVGRSDIRIDLDFGHLLTGLDHVGEGSLLKIRRALHRPDQIRNEISAPLVDILNVCPAAIHLLL